MKDPHGHGSNGRGLSAMNARRIAEFGATAGSRVLRGGGEPHKSNAHAARAIKYGGKKSVLVDHHDAMDYNRDFRLRARNGQVGSGMRAR